jgi:hypothetical protein
MTESAARSRLILAVRCMCELCVKIEDQIRHYRTFLKQHFDALTTERIKESILELEQRKVAIHR